MRAAKVAHIEDFNGVLKKLTCGLVVRFPADPSIARAKKRIMLAIDLDPVFIIEAIGPYLYEYRDQVYAGNDSFFLANDYDAELRDSVDPEKAGLAAHIIPKVKQAWASAPAAEQAVYTETVQTLLDSYVEYLALKLQE
jgi:hypothetical protein